MKKQCYLIMVLKIPDKLQHLRWKARQYGNTTVYVVRNKRDLRRLLPDIFVTIALNQRYAQVSARVHTQEGKFQTVHNLTKQQVLRPQFWVNQAQKHAEFKVLQLLLAA